MEKKTIAVCAIIGVMEHERTNTKDSFDLIVQSINSDESDPLLQLDSIHDLSELLKTTHLDDEEASSLYSTIEDASARKNNAPLVSLSLKYLKECIAKDFLHDDSIRTRLSKPFVDDLQNQDQLHKAYPALPSDHIVVRMAPGVAYSLDDYHSMESVALKNAADQADIFIELLSLDNGTEVPIWLVPFAHDVRFRGLIEENLSLNLADLPLESQIQLLAFMSQSNDGRFDRLCGTMHELNSDLRLKLAENFLAADFGEDFGDALLTVAESTRFDDKEKEAILDNITSCRESIKSITGLYEHIDGEFAKEYARAANERLTDAITVFAEIAKKGHAEADLGWAGHPRFDYETAFEALDYERKSLEIISGTFNDVIDGKDGAYAKIVLHPDEEFQRLRRTVYDLYSPDHGHVLIYTRADGSHSFDPDVEYGKVGSRYNEGSRNTGVEASISMIADPANPFATISPYKPNRFALKNLNYYDDNTMNKVSAIRLDREGRAPGWAADDSRRDPVNQVGTISVDLAAIGDRADTPSGKIARLLAIGNSLRASRMGSEASLNHNTNWFNQAKYGTSDGFKKIVEGFDMSLRRLVEIRQPRTRLKKIGKIAANTTKTGDDSAA